MADSSVILGSPAEDHRVCAASCRRVWINPGGPEPRVLQDKKIWRGGGGGGGGGGPWLTSRPNEVAAITGARLLHAPRRARCRINDAERRRKLDRGCWKGWMGGGGGCPGIWEVCVCVGGGVGRARDKVGKGCQGI